MVVFADSVDALARRVVPMAVCRHVKDTLVLWKILVSWLQEECKTEVFDGMSNSDAASMLSSLRSARNQTQHSRCITTKEFLDTAAGVNALLHARLPFFTVDDHTRLEAQACAFANTCRAMGYQVIFHELAGRAVGDERQEGTPSVGVDELTSSVSHLQLSGSCHRLPNFTSPSPFSLPSPALPSALPTLPLPCCPAAHLPSVEEARRTQLVPLPAGVCAEVGPATFRELKATHKAALKRRALWIHSGKFRGRMCSFMMWNGSTVYCHFEPEGKRALSSSHTVSVLKNTS